MGIAVADRPYQIQDSDAITCPRCRALLNRVRPVLGSLLASCNAKVDDSIKPRVASGRARCGQHIHILGAPEGVSIVVPISKAEFDAALGAGVKVSRDSYREWGVMPNA